VDFSVSSEDFLKKGRIISTFLSAQWPGGILGDLLEKNVKNSDVFFGRWKSQAT
jgi:hypothetical protein